jgi:hypothetical protein
VPRASFVRLDLLTLLGNGVALVSFALALLYPLAMVANAAWLLIWNPLPGWQSAPLAFVYSAIDYVAPPAILFAAFVAGLALALRPPWRRMATVALAIDGLSVLFLLAVLGGMLFLQAIGR